MDKRGRIKFLKKNFGKIHLSFLTILTIIVLAVGSVFYHVVEKLPWIDALYLSVITVTTVGYGDFTPVTYEGKIFTMIYIFVGIGIIFAFIDFIASKRYKFRKS